MGLGRYREKRDFSVTPEPRGKAVRGSNRYVIQKHDASRLHYDLRLELDGVMRSWAVTRGPSLDPAEKRLAIEVEDHPVEYNTFEGTIPAGEYGAGTVMIWDRGRWQPEGDPHAALRKGHLTFTLEGEKLKGRWNLVRLRKRANERRKSWLLIKSRDKSARDASQDVLEQMPLSVKSGRTLPQIAAGLHGRRTWRSNRRAAAAAVTEKRTAEPKAARRPNTRAPLKRRGSDLSRPADTAGVSFTHPDRIYWADVGITKQDLADYYRAVWDVMAPQVVGRPLALVRCPEGTKGQCFFQKHASAGLPEQHLRTVIDRNGRQILALDDLDGLLSLVQAGALEIHVRGSNIERLDLCDRIIFDLDPGQGVDWREIVAAAREVRDRLAAHKLESFVKLSGGKGLHVMLPIEGTDWAVAKAFAQGIAAAMAADAPERYVAKIAKALRKGKILIDYLRNSVEQTSVAAYSTRARAGAPVATPVSWSELGRTRSGHQFTMTNLAKRLSALKQNPRKQDPWADVGRVRQSLPDSRRSQTRP